MKTETVPPPAADRPSHVPPAVWARCVDHVRRLAKDAPSFWPLWAATYRKFLMRTPDGARSDVFGRLFDEYQAAGGSGSTFDDGGVSIAVDAADVVGATTGPAAW